MSKIGWSTETKISEGGEDHNNASDKDEFLYPCIPEDPILKKINLTIGPHFSILKMEAKI